MLSILVTIATMTKNPSEYVFLKMEQCIKILQEVNQSVSIDYWMDSILQTLHSCSPEDKLKQL